jgi:vacuolar-type H+-ATPase subunit H
MKLYHYFTLLVALGISACAAYYSIVGLTAIFASSVIPIIIMGSVLELAKITGAIWLKVYWEEASFWIKAYLLPSIAILMFVTSMGIFGFLSKAHIEQTAGAQEGIAQIERLNTDIARQEDLILRAEQRITKASSSTTNNNDNTQEQIDTEQDRIDTAYARIQPAIDEQSKIIEDARSDSESRIQPYKDQLQSTENELLSLAQQASDVESRISKLSADTSATQPLLDSIKNIEEEIIRVTNQLQSGERDQVRAGQAIIGVSSDGAFGGNTRRTLVTWVEAQRARITQVQLDVSQIRQDATIQVDAERVRLTDLVANIRGQQTEQLRQRRIEILANIDSLQSSEPPVVITAREEIARVRATADAQIAASQSLIQRLRDSLTVGDDTTVDAIIAEQTVKIKEANDIIDDLTTQRYALESENRKLEAEVGPIKYIANLIYGDNAGPDILEKSVRWMILLLVIVFDPLAVILTMAAVSGITNFGKPQVQKKRTENQTNI